jgi:hypothetical protein
MPVDSATAALILATVLIGLAFLNLLVLGGLLVMGGKIMAVLDAVNANLTVLEASAAASVTELNALGVKVSAGAMSPADAQAVADRIMAVSAALDAANAANLAASQ